MSEPATVVNVGHYSDVVFEEIGPFGTGEGAVSFFLFKTSGQKPLVPDNTKPEGFSVVEGGIEEQTIQVFRNFENILKPQGLGLKDVTRVQVFLANLDDFNRFNGAYATCFGDHKPARAVLGGKIRYKAGLEMILEGRAPNGWRPPVKTLG